MNRVSPTQRTLIKCLNDRNLCGQVDGEMITVPRAGVTVHVRKDGFIIQMETFTNIFGEVEYRMPSGGSYKTWRNANRFINWVHRQRR